MKKIIFIMLCIFILVDTAWALEPLVTYRNYSPTADEDVQVSSDINFAIKPDYINDYVLAADVHQIITPPADASFMLLNSTGNIWVRYGGTAVVPSVNITTGLGSELNPTLRYIGGITSIGIISSSETIVSAIFWK